MTDSEQLTVYVEKRDLQKRAIEALLRALSLGQSIVPFSIKEKWVVLIIPPCVDREREIVKLASYSVNSECYGAVKQLADCEPTLDWAQPLLNSALRAIAQVEGLQVERRERIMKQLRELL